MQKRLAVPLIVAAIFGCSENPTQLPEAKPLAPRAGGPAPLYLAPTRLAGTLPDRYIVVVNDDAGDAVGVSRDIGRALGFNALVAWNKGLRFFAAELSPAVVQAIRLDPRVKYVEEDQKLHLLDTYPNPPSWGLDRVDQQNLPLNNTYQDYLGGNTTLVTTHAYIIDTGIRYTHAEFEGRAAPAFDFDSVTSPRGSPNFAADCNGHGTHVAGTVGGRTFGVSKRVLLYGVRVLNCVGSDPSSPFASQVISGINWVTANAVHPAVANVSLGGSASQALDDAVRASISSGVTYVIAAGNDGGNACNVSPARVAEAITVAATDITDSRPTFSDFGSCVDLFAPGVDITSAWSGSDTDFRNESGTSMAAPHVTGVVANLMALIPEANQPAQVHSAIINQVTTGVVKNPGASSPNRLVYSISPFNIIVRGPQEVGCNETVTYTIEGQGGVGPYTNYHGYLTHTYGDMFKTWTGPDFVEHTPPPPASVQSMALQVYLTDARGPEGNVFWPIFLCEEYG